MKLNNIAFYARGYVRSKRFSRPPIIIGGCERSGTTLLRSVLSAHPRIHAIADELWAFCHAEVAGFKGQRPIRVSRLYKYLGQHPIHPSAVRWCEKSPANIVFFDDILEYFDGRVRLIQLVRDGRDVVCSRHPQKPKSYWMRVQRWVNALEIGLPYRRHPNALTIRYEDLILDHEQTVQRILDFVGEENCEEMRDWHAHASVRSSANLIGGAVPPIHSGSIRKFEAEGFEHGARVEELMSHPAVPALLRTYGYE
jgi:hypothetical protein